MCVCAALKEPEYGFVLTNTQPNPGKGRHHRLKQPFPALRRALIVSFCVLMGVISVFMDPNCATNMVISCFLRKSESQICITAGLNNLVSLFFYLLAAT